MLILQNCSDVTKADKGAAMTLIFQESGIGHQARCKKEEVLIATNSKGRVLYHKKLGTYKERKIDFPLEIFLENHCVTLRHNLKDTHIAICSAAVLPLFTDNFDFQTMDDFIRGLLINEEILGMTIYSDILKGGQFGGAVTNWRTYQTLRYALCAFLIVKLMYSNYICNFIIAVMNSRTIGYIPLCHHLRGKFFIIHVVEICLIKEINVLQE